MGRLRKAVTDQLNQPAPPEPTIAPQEGPPYKTGDLVCLKSGGFPMTVIETGFVKSCSDPDGYWLVNVVYAPERLEDHVGVRMNGTGLIYDELDAALLKPSSGFGRDMDDNIPF